VVSVNVYKGDFEHSGWGMWADGIRPE
jgi:hypothetical protein